MIIRHNRKLNKICLQKKSNMFETKKQTLTKHLFSKFFRDKIIKVCVIVPHVLGQLFVLLEQGTAFTMTPLNHRIEKREGIF